MTTVVNPFKSGFKTSEFWVTVLGHTVNALGAYGHFIPQPWGIIAATIGQAVYTIARTVLKTS